MDNVLWKGAVLKHHNEVKSLHTLIAIIYLITYRVFAQRPDVGTPRDADKRTQEEHKLFEKGRRMHLFNEHIRHHPNLTSLMLPFRDGLTVAQFKIKS